MTGRPTSFTDEQEVKANEYIDGGYKDADEVIPSAMGMARHLGVAESTIYQWAVDGRGTFPETLARCKSQQHLVLVNKGLTNDFNATIVKLALSNHGYSEKTSTDITSGGEKIQNNYNVHPTTTKDG